MQIDLSQLFITMPACYGKLDQGVNYTIQQVLDYIDELGGSDFRNGSQT